MNKSIATRNIEDCLPLILLIFAIFDLRVEILIICNHFTFTAVLFALRHHPLAVIVLLATPSMWRRYGISIRTILGG